MPHLPRSHARLKANRGIVCLSVGAASLLAATTLAQAHNNKVSIQETGSERCIISNGLPNHSTGSFPNRGNPNRISAQNIRLCVPKNPRKNSRAKRIGGSIGVALNGVQIRPGTADWYDSSSRRGHSRNRASGWNLEGMGAADKLGMDRNSAHVDNRGLYHYHGVSSALRRQGKGTLIGYAADGFEIHYVGKKKKPSYRLKSGTRPSAPGGRYDGTYVQDWSYVAGSGNLDRCNGGKLNGKFVYFATDSYPFFPRCLWGNVSSDFSHGRAAGRGQGGQPPQGQFSGPGRPGNFNEQQGNDNQLGNEPHRRIFGFGQNNQRQNDMRRNNLPQNGQRQFGQRQSDPRMNNRDQGRNTQLARGPQGGNRQGGRFGPPPEALEACRGKSQGQSCSMQTPRGQLSGSCIQTPDRQTACLPQGHRPPRRQ